MVNSGMRSGYGGDLRLPNHYYHYDDRSCSALSRTQFRRQQRKHTIQCLRTGAKQRIQHAVGLDMQDLLTKSGQMHQLLCSLAAHKSDAQSLGANIHFAGQANVLAFSQQLKSKKTFKAHRSLHQDANKIKHEVDLDCNFVKMPPIPDGSIWASDLEAFQIKLYAKESHDCGNHGDQLPSQVDSINCSWCGTWLPLYTNCQKHYANPQKWAPIDPASDFGVDDLQRSCPSDSIEGIDEIEVINEQHSDHFDAEPVSQYATPLDDSCVVLNKGSLEKQEIPLPRLEFLSIRDAGATVSCSWLHAEIVQPHLGVFVELNGGSVETYTC
jgi:hypothetical protein